MRDLGALALVLSCLLSAANAFAAEQIHWTVTGQTSVTFDWYGSDTTIRYGLTTSYGQSATAVSQAGAKCDPATVPGNSSTGPYMEARLTGLLENTLYHYSIGSGADHTFRTPPPRGISGFSVMAQSDIGDSSSYSNVPAIQNLIATDLPAFVVTPGDLTYKNDHGYPHDQRHFNDVMVWSQDAAYFPAWGNHEWDGPSYDDLRNYKGRFDFANPQSTPGHTPPKSDCGEDWYWFDYGNVRFITFPEPTANSDSTGSSDSASWGDWNTSMNDPAGPMATAQSDPNIKFIVTFGHRPSYSSGHHTGESTLKGYSDALGDKYSKYVLNLNGHSHNYERTFPQHGVVHLTVGTGGAGLEQDGSCLWLTCTQPSYSAKRYMRHGVTKLTFGPTSIDGKFICGPSGGGTNDVSCNVGDVIDTFTIGTPTIDTTPPSVPASLAATAVSSSLINLTWLPSTDNVSVTGYKVLRSTTSGGPYSQIGTSVAPSYSDTGLIGSTTYFYVVQAYDAAGNTSGNSNPSSATTQSPPAPPTAPSSLTGSAASASQINLSWADNSANEDGFKIERCQGAGCTSFSEIKTTAANALSYQDTGLQASTSYGYRVRAYNSGGNSGYSNTATATTQAPPPPGATLLSDDFETDTVGGGASGWTVVGGTWSVALDGTKVYQQSATGDAWSYTGSAAWTDYAVTMDIKPSSFSGADVFVALYGRWADSTHWYYVTLRNTNVLELKKNVGGVYTPLATTPFTVSAGSWYTVKLEMIGANLKVYVNGALQLSATDSSIASGSIAVGGYNSSAEFDKVVVTSASGGGPPDTTPPVITNVTATSITGTSATINWSTNEPANSYVEYGLTTSYGSNASDGSMVTLHAVLLSNLTPGTTYHYHVRSTDAAGNTSAFSADKTFTTSTDTTPPPAPARVTRTDKK